MRQTSDGRLWVPARGKPPEPPQGYKRDPRDKFCFIPILEDCENRIIKDHKCCKGKIKKVMFCKVNNKRITYKECRDCPLLQY